MAKNWRGIVRAAAEVLAAFAAFGAFIYLAFVAMGPLP